MWDDNYLDKRLKNKLQKITLECTLQPTVSILSVEEAKNYIKVNHTNDDSLITTLINTSVNSAENIIHKAICKSGYTQKQNGGINELKLMRCPVIGSPTVTHYDTFDSTGSSLILNTDFRIVGNVLYHADNYFVKGRRGDGYKIEYEAGLFTSSVDDKSMVYSACKTFMARCVAYLYENRQMYCTNFNEENWSIAYNTNDIPIEIKSILLPFRTPNLGVL